MGKGELIWVSSSDERHAAVETVASMLGLKTGRHLRQWQPELVTPRPGRKLVVIHQMKDVRESLSILPLGEADVCHLAMTPNVSMEEEVLLLLGGFNGVLLREAEPEDIIRAFRRVLADNLAFSGIALSHYILRHARNTVSEAKMKIMLSTTRKEQEVLALVCQGLSNDEVAEQLSVSINTVKMHLQNIYKKTNLKGRRQLLAAYAGIQV
ncbi:LuxR C-terminal-related transcriptional regulator [Gallaecimonas sp. GXIMD4217]|uniref:helix-turn-helix transcriptional regulator n=1 Tax=Gallaecimonas sp. GXIMD4217 TaxID=3131927 RepID=UPI00311AE3E7